MWLKWMDLGPAHAYDDRALSIWTSLHKRANSGGGNGGGPRTTSWMSMMMIEARAGKFESTDITGLLKMMVYMHPSLYIYICGVCVLWTPRRPQTEC